MKTLIAKTHIAEVRHANQSQLQQVCKVIAWSEAQYCDYLFEEYVAFVKRMFFGYPNALYLDALYSSVMAGFWKNEACKRDAEYLEYANRELEPYLELLEDFEGVFCIDEAKPGDCYLVDEFQLLHNHKRLINDHSFMNNYCKILKQIK